MRDPRRGQLFIVEAREDGGGCEMKRGCLGKVFLWGRKRMCRAITQPCGRERGREIQHREKRGAGRGGPRDVGGWEWRRGASPSHKAAAMCSVQPLQKTVSLAFSLVEPALTYHPAVTPLGCFICDYSSIFMQWKEFWKFELKLFLRSVYLKF